MSAFRRILAAVALFFGLAITPTLTPNTAGAATPYLQCVYSPGSSSGTTYGGSICFRHNTGVTVLFRTRINCQYFSGVLYSHYTVYSGWQTADNGGYAWAYCQNHHDRSCNTCPAGSPDIVIHSQVEYYPYDSVSFVNGGF